VDFIPGSGPGGRRFKSFRPERSSQNQQFTEYIKVADRPVSGQEVHGSKSNRSDAAIPRSLINLHRNCVVSYDTWNLSNLSNSLFNDLTNGQGIRLLGAQEWT
jgi:hypothetical protein